MTRCESIFVGSDVDDLLFYRTLRCASARLYARRRRGQHIAFYRVQLRSNRWPLYAPNVAGKRLRQERSHASLGENQHAFTEVRLVMRPGRSIERSLTTASWNCRKPISRSRFVESVRRSSFQPGEVAVTVDADPSGKFAVRL